MGGAKQTGTLQVKCVDTEIQRQVAAPSGLLAPLGDCVLGGGVVMAGGANDTDEATSGTTAAGTAGGGTGRTAFTAFWFSIMAMSPPPPAGIGAGAARQFNQVADQPSSAAKAKTEASVATRGSFWITVALN